MTHFLTETDSRADQKRNDQIELKNTFLFLLHFISLSQLNCCKKRTHKKKVYQIASSDTIENI